MNANGCRLCGDKMPMRVQVHMPFPVPFDVFFHALVIRSEMDHARRTRTRAHVRRM